jgi:hypothetical protein
MGPIDHAVEILHKLEERLIREGEQKNFNTLADLYTLSRFLFNVEKEMRK